MGDVLYGKLGRAINLDLKNASTDGGDVDVARALHRLATARPEDTFVVVGRNSGENPQDIGYPANVRNLWNEEPLCSMKLSAGKMRQKSEYTDVIMENFGDVILGATGCIMWLGQHGTTNRKGGLPTTKDREKWTNPYDSSVIYCAYLLAIINRWRDVDPLAREEVWLCPDPRNYIKCRDNRWPLQHPVLAQYQYEREVSHERYGINGSPSDFGFPRGVSWTDCDRPGRWFAKSRYVYSALELTALPAPDRVPFDISNPRHEFGIISNENRAYVAADRLSAMKQWVLGWYPEVPLFGKWGKESQEALGREIAPVPLLSMLPTMAQFRATFTMPASGSEWATAKPWEAFATGTICFFHPKYDGQDWILRELPQEVRNFLRVKTPAELEARVKQLSTDFSLYSRMAIAQREAYERRFAETRGGVAAILDRLETVSVA